MKSVELFAAFLACKNKDHSSVLRLPSSNIKSIKLTSRYEMAEENLRLTVQLLVVFLIGTLNSAV